ncbi:MAG: 2-hydroxyacid dehydrogenase [Nitrososphaeria archaeon]
MAAFKVVVTAPMREEGLQLLRREADVIVFPRLPTEQDLKEAVRDADALLVTLNVERVTGAVIESAQRLKVIARHGVGYDNVDVDEATARGIWVTTAPVLNETVADQAFALLLSLARRICESSYHVRSKKWIKRDPMLFVGTDVWGKTIGIIGLGRIGLCIAERARGFKMNLLYYDVVRKKELEDATGIRFKLMEELLKESDFVVVSCSLTEQTRGLLGEDELKKMKNTAYVINVARGPIIDHGALVKALKEKWIAGAGLDVFHQEPLPLDDPILELDNVLLTPHLASNTIECRKRMAVVAAEEILRVLHGQKPLYPVNTVQ